MLQTGGAAPLVWYLSGMHEALGLIPSTDKPAMMVQAWEAEPGEPEVHCQP